MKDEQIDALVAMEPHTTALLLNDWNKIFVDIGFREAPAGVVFLASGKTLAVSPRLNQRMENDDQEVLFDLIVTCQAYVSDWKRSFYLGTPPKEIVDLYEFEWRIVQTLVQELKPGMTTIEAYTACDERLKKDGLVNWWCIHSVGLEIHEEPLIGGSPMVSENGDVDMTATARFPGLLRDGSEKITFRTESGGHG